MSVAWVEKVSVGRLLKAIMEDTGQTNFLEKNGAIIRLWSTLIFFKEP